MKYTDIYGGTVTKLIKEYENTYLAEDTKGEKWLVHKDDVNRGNKRKRFRENNSYGRFDLKECQKQGRPILMSKPKPKYARGRK